MKVVTVVTLATLVTVDTVVTVVTVVMVVTKNFLHQKTIFSKKKFLQQLVDDKF